MAKPFFDAPLPYRFAHRGATRGGQIDENTYLFGQIGRVWLPSVSTTQGAQTTEYGRWGINNLAIGVRWAFRDLDRK